MTSPARQTNPQSLWESRCGLNATFANGEGAMPATAVTHTCHLYLVVGHASSAVGNFHAALITACFDHHVSSAGAIVANHASRSSSSNSDHVCPPSSRSDTVAGMFAARRASTNWTVHWKIIASTAIPPNGGNAPGGMRSTAPTFAMPECDPEISAGPQSVSAYGDGQSRPSLVLASKTGAGGYCARGPCKRLSLWDPISAFGVVVPKLFSAGLQSLEVGSFRRWPVRAGPRVCGLRTAGTSPTVIWGEGAWHDHPRNCVVGRRVLGWDLDPVDDRHHPRDRRSHPFRARCCWACGRWQAALLLMSPRRRALRFPSKLVPSDTG